MRSVVQCSGNLCLVVANANNQNSLPLSIVWIVDDNLLTGTIPTELALLTDLTYLRLGKLSFVQR